MKLFRKLFLILTLITSVLFVSSNFLNQKEKYVGFISQEQLNQYIKSNTIIPNETKVLGAGGEVKIYLTTTGGSTNWTVPSDWNNSNNSIECIGAGAGGLSATYNSRGGGGGAYAKKNNFNLQPGQSIPYVVSVGGGGCYGGTVSTTYFKQNNSSGVVAAPAVGVNGGTITSSYGDVEFAGGNGGTIVSGAFNGGSGGGSVGGPIANGGNGYTNSSSTGGNGGDSYSYSGGVAATNPNGLDLYVSGSYVFGSGGSGSTRGSGINGGNGGFPGGGGGGEASGTTCGYGAQGMIVITYVPVSSGNFNFFFFN